MDAIPPPSPLEDHATSSSATEPDQPSPGNIKSSSWWQPFFLLPRVAQNTAAGGHALVDQSPKWRGSSFDPE
jgi:hypothetical protein